MHCRVLGVIYLATFAVLLRSIYRDSVHPSHPPARRPCCLISSLESGCVRFDLGHTVAAAQSYRLHLGNRNLESQLPGTEYNNNNATTMVFTNEHKTLQHQANTVGCYVASLVDYQVPSRVMLCGVVWCGVVQIWHQLMCSPFALAVSQPHLQILTGPFSPHPRRTWSRADVPRSVLLICQLEPRNTVRWPSTPVISGVILPHMCHTLGVLDRHTGNFASILHEQ
jgi:hypothetical protein